MRKLLSLIVCVGFALCGESGAEDLPDASALRESVMREQLQELARKNGADVPVSEIGRELQAQQNANAASGNAPVSAHVVTQPSYTPQAPVQAAAQPDNQQGASASYADPIAGIPLRAARRAEAPEPVAQPIALRGDVTPDARQDGIGNESGLRAPNASSSRDTVLPTSGPREGMTKLRARAVRLPFESPTAEWATYSATGKHGRAPTFEEIE